MREARNFISAEFWPEAAEDTLRIARSYPSPENTWLRQLTSYWEMAASFVLRGARHEGLFFDASGEMYCVYAKFRPFLPEIRQKLPYFLLTVEKVILRTEDGRQRLQRLERSLSRRRQKLAERCAAVAATSPVSICRRLTTRGDTRHGNSTPRCRIINPASSEKDTVPPEHCSSEKTLLRWPLVSAAPTLHFRLDQPLRGRYGCSSHSSIFGSGTRAECERAPLLLAGPQELALPENSALARLRPCAALPRSRRRLWLTCTPAVVEVKPGRFSRLACVARRAGPNSSLSTRRCPSSITWSRRSWRKCSRSKPLTSPP